MKQIYSEGRVVGLNPWELYVRQLLSTNPSATPLTERQWLSTTLHCNAAMVLYIPNGTTKGYHDYILPSTSDLCACSTLTASVFEGTCPTDSERHYWGVTVDDYGHLIENTLTTHPVTPGNPLNVPVKSESAAILEDFKQMCKEYLKITDGLYIQPGTWTSPIYDTPLQIETGDDLLIEDGQQLLVPWADGIEHYAYTPDLTRPGFIRLWFSQKITHELYILITGFTYKCVVMGEVGFDKIVMTDHPQDGDFLGPAEFPWASKVRLTLTTNEVQHLIS